MDKILTLLEDCLIACIISAVAGLVISAFIASLFSLLSPLGQWNWQQNIFLFGWAGIFVVGLVVIAIATMIENHREKYADNE